MKLKQSTRILILLALIVAAIAVWYSLFFASKQPAPAAEAVTSIPRKTEKVAATKPVAVTTSARALQVLPIPFLVTEAPEEAPLEPTQNEVAIAIANTNVPPNPFVPLHVKTEGQQKTSPNKPAQVPESEKPVLVTPGTELAPNIPIPKTITPEGETAAPPPVATLGKGTLPIKLSPLDREVSSVEPLAEAIAENEAEANAAAGNGDEGGTIEKGSPAEGGENAEQEAPTEQATEENEEQPQVEEPPPPNPLEIWARQQRLRLDGVALGPVGVAIFETASGYLALPVGQTFPNDNVLVKTITADRVLLVDDSGTNTLTLELGGGE